MKNEFAWKTVVLEIKWMISSSNLYFLRHLLCVYSTVQLNSRKNRKNNQLTHLTIFGSKHRSKWLHYEQFACINIVCLPVSHVRCTFFSWLGIHLLRLDINILMLWTSYGIYCHWQTNFINRIFLFLARVFFSRLPLQFDMDLGCSYTKKDMKKVWIMSIKTHDKKAHRHTIGCYETKILSSSWIVIIAKILLFFNGLCLCCCCCCWSLLIWMQKRWFGWLCRLKSNKS